MARWDYRFGVLERLKTGGVLPTVNLGGTDVVDYVHVAEVLLEGGVSTMEILYRPEPGEVGQNIFDAIREIWTKFDRKMLIGCGTLQTREETLDAIKYGAQFIVSNAAAVEVVEAANLKGVLVIPAAETQQEVRSLLPYGINVVKLFMPHPLNARASIMRLRQFRSAFPALEFIATAGVNLKNLDLFLAEGYPFLVVGDIVSRKDVKHGEWSKIRDRASAYVERVRTVRKILEEVNPHTKFGVGVKSPTS